MTVRLKTKKKTPLLQKRNLQVRLKYAKDDLEKDYAHLKHVLWSDETQLERFATEMPLMFRERRERRTQRTASPQ